MRVSSPETPNGSSFEEKVGPVTIRVEPGERPLIWLTTPAISHGRTFDREQCAQALGLMQSDLFEDSPSASECRQSHHFHRR